MTSSFSASSVGDRLRRETPYGVSSDGKASSLTPCPRSGQSRPAWLWHGACCPLDKELHRVYGFGCVEYHRLLDAQGGVCAVCGRRPGRWRLAADHDHETGVVRGLCHHRCQRWITTQVVAYLADPPGYGLDGGTLRVPATKMRALEERARAKRRRAAAKRALANITPPTDDEFGRRVQAALQATSKEA